MLIEFSVANFRSFRDRVTLSLEAEPRISERDKTVDERNVAHTADGDLTPLFDAYFDTRTGPKLEAASYAVIARAIGLGPGDILFLSDAPGEVSAAQAAGMAAIRIDRALPPGTRRRDAGGDVAADFAVVDALIAAG